VFAHGNMRRDFSGVKLAERRYTEASEKGPWCMHDLPYDQPCVCCQAIEKRDETLWPEGIGQTC
jgi:hypothetical protein